MSAHLLPISPEWWGELPQWTPVVYDSEGERRRGFVDHVRRAILDEGQRPHVGFGCPGLLVWLDLSGLLAAAVVATRVRAWHRDATPAEVRRAGGLDAADFDTVARAAWMEPLTPSQITTLARLARAAMEAA
jgi:hypothetical protein